MIEIQDNKIIRDGVDIGQIEDGTAYVTEKQPPRVVGQIRAAAGNPDLVISVRAEALKSSQTIIGSNAEMAAEMPVPGAATEPSPGEAPTVKESLTVEDQPEIGVTVEFPDEPVKIEEAPRPAPAPKWDLTGFPPVGDKTFARSFINAYGPDEYAKWQKSQAE